MAKIGGGGEEGRSMLRMVFVSGLRSIVICDVSPNLSMLRFEQTKEHSPLLFYFKEE